MDSLPLTSSFSVRRARHHNVIEAGQCRRYVEHLGREMKRVQTAREKETAELEHHMDRIWHTTGYYGRKNSTDSNDNPSTSPFT